MLKSGLGLCLYTAVAYGYLVQDPQVRNNESKEGMALTGYDMALPHSFMHIRLR